MAFLFGQTKMPTTPEPKLAGVGPEDTNTNEQARPLPYMAGVARMPVTWLGPAYNVRTVAIKRKAGKKKTTVGYQYYAGVAGLVCSGPVDKIRQIWMNRELVWEGEISRASTDYATITVENRGQFRIYWGTDTQDVDDLLLDSVSDAHPPYRRQCYVVCPDLYWGNNVTTAPSIEVVIERHPFPSWSVTSSNISDDANPAYVIAELLQDPVFGLGLPDARIDTSTFISESAYYFDFGMGLSPVIDKQSSVRNVIVQFGEHIDVWLGTTDDGKFRIKTPAIFPSVGAITLVDEDDLEEAPQLKNEGWDGVTTTTWMRYKNKAADFKEDLVGYRDQGALAIVAAHKTQTIQRPWITRNDLAEATVSKIGRLAAAPKYSGRVSMADTEAARINLGGLLRINWAESNLTNLVGIVESITIPEPGQRFWQVEFKEWHNDLYKDNANQIGTITPPTETVIEVEDLYASAITELPLGLASTSDITFAALLARGDSLTSGANVWLEQGTGTFDQIAQIEAFAVKGKLNAPYSAFTDFYDTTDALEILLQSPDKDLESQSSVQAQNKTLLMWINPGLSNEEIISIETVTLVSGNVYSIQGYRGRYDTRRRTHAAISSVYIIERAALLELYDSEIIESGNTYDLKFQPYLGSQEYDLSSVTAKTSPTASGRYSLPHPPKNLDINGAESGATYDSASDDIVLTWDNPDGFKAGDEFVLKFYDENESTLYHSVTLVGVTTYTRTNAEIFNDYGGYPNSVVVRAEGKRGGNASKFYDVVKCDKL